MTHPSLGLALGLPPGSLPPHLPPGYTTSGQLPVGQPTSGRLIGQSQKPTTGRVQPITNPSQKQAASETGKKLGNVLKCHKIDTKMSEKSIGLFFFDIFVFLCYFSSFLMI